MRSRIGMPGMRKWVKWDSVIWDFKTGAILSNWTWEVNGKNEGH